MREVARVLVGNAHRQLSERRAVGGDRKVLVDIPHTRGDRRCALGPLWIAFEEVRVALQKSAAARGIGEDRLGSGALEGRDVALREPDRLRVVAGVRVQRAAAALVRHFNDPRR